MLLVSLKKKDFDEKTIATLSKLIHQKILFILEYKDESKVAIYHTRLIQTDWKKTDEQCVEIKGLSLDKVWENIVVSVGNVSIEEGKSLDEQIFIDEKRQKIEKAIAKLEKQARAEKQPKRKYEFVQRMKEYRKKLEELKSE